MGMFRNLMIASGTRRRDPLYGIHYVADWDGKDRSNEEDEPMRSQWVDKKTGKVIELHNFGYAGLSGWNGYERNWDEWLDVYIENNGHNYQENNVLHILEISPWANTLSDVVSGETVKLKLRVSGLSEGITNNEVQNIQLYFNVSTADLTLYIREDGDYDVNLTAPEGAIKFYILAKSTETLTGWTSLTTPITIEQLPLYPGALVGDGIDDYGVTQEAINEEVGTMLMMAYLISRPNDGIWASFVNTLVQTVPGWISASIYSQGQNLVVNQGFSPSSVPNILDRIVISGHSREPASPGSSLYICAAASNVSFANVAIYRLILIREQLNETQIAYLVNKVQKEYNDWCRANGYEYAINQLTE